ncbi:MAG: divergent polysaccharide deacetylase family protein [Pseudomonadota bacterium]
MSDFRTVLDDEVQKAVNDSIKENHGPKVQRIKFKLNPLKLLSNLFSFKSFFKGLVLVACIYAALFSWLLINGDKTITGLKNRLPSKTVTIERGNSFELQPVVNIPPVIQPPAEQDLPDQASQQNESVSNNQISNTLQGGLTAAPVPGLFESVKEGLIPKARLEDGMTPFDAYKKPFIPQSQKPKIAFLATNIGMSRRLTQKMIEELPSEISLGFSPYAPNLKLLHDAARTDGHETWLVLPAENEGYPRNDPGPLTILKTASIEQNQARLFQTMGRVSGYVGLISWPNHIFSPKDSETSSVIQQIFGRGLAIIDSSPSTSRDFGRRIAYNNEFPFAKNNFWLDQSLNTSSMKAQFKSLEDYATARGQALMMFRPHPKSFQMIKEWLSSPKAEQFEVVPASFVTEYRDE